MVYKDTVVVEVFKVLDDAGIPAGVANLITAQDPEPIGEEFITNPLVHKLGDLPLGHPRPGKLLYLSKQLLGGGNRRSHPCNFGGSFSTAQGANQFPSRNKPAGQGCTGHQVLQG